MRSTSRLSADTISAMKDHCFNNMGEFYNRYGEHLEVGRSTFYRLMAGYPCATSKVLNVETAAQRLGIKKSMDQGWVERKKILIKLIELVDLLCQHMTLDHVGNLRLFIHKHRFTILGSK